MADSTDTPKERTPSTLPDAKPPVAASPVPGPPGAPERALPGGPMPDGARGNGRPGDPDEMREEIERTRQRMSTTLDSIEARLVQRKREIWAKATFQGVRRTIATEPWRSMAIAFAVGYVVAAIRD